MQAVVQGFLSQSAKMDPLERVRRWKRSLDGYISFRKAVLLALVIFAFILYVGPSIFSWLFSSNHRRHYDSPKSSPPNDIVWLLFAILSYFKQEVLKYILACQAELGDNYH